MARNKSTAIENAPAARLYDRTGAASYLSISVSMLDALRARGEIRVVALPAAHRLDERSRVPLFDKHDLDALIDTWKEAAR